jgi:hypothetical protein
MTDKKLNPAHTSRNCALETRRIPVDVAGEKYTIRREACVRLRPWSPNRSWISWRRRLAIRLGVRCEGEGRRKVRYAGLEVGWVVEDGEEEG